MIEVFLGFPQFLQENVQTSLSYATVVTFHIISHSVARRLRKAVSLLHSVQTGSGGPPSLVPRVFNGWGMKMTTDLLASNLRIFGDISPLPYTSSRRDD
jgi:hypothetical protein